MRPLQYLNYDVAADRLLIGRQSWSPRSELLVLDEIHKMPDWKGWLKGVADGKPKQQRLLVTGSARMDTFRQGGDSLAGRCYLLRLHPISVREWCAHAPSAKPTPEQALTRLLERGGFPEPFLAEDPVQAERWRRLYLDGLVREDVLEFSRLQEVTALRLFVELLRERVVRFAGEFPQARAVQVLRDLRQPEQRGAIEIARAGEWLNQLSA